MSINERKVGQVYLWKSELFVQLPEEEHLDRARVRVGTFETTLKLAPNVADVEAKLPLRAEFHLRKSGELLPLLQLDGVPTGAGVEGLENSNATPSAEITRLMQFKLHYVRYPQFFNVGPKISLKLQEQHSRAEVRMLAAVQRSGVKVLVSFYSALSGQDHVVEVPLDIRHAGGNRTEDFQRIIVPCPFEGSCTASIKIMVEADPSEQAGTELCFIANAEVIAPINFRELSLPMMGNTSALVNGVWCSTSLRSLIDSDGANIELILGEDIKTILQVPANHITLVENFGHALSVRASRKDNFVLEIDSIPVKKILLNEVSTWIEIPCRFLIGEPILVTIRDFSASQVLFQMPLIGLPLITPADALRDYSKAPYPVELSTRQSFRYRGLKELFLSDLQRPCLASIGKAINALDEGLQAIKISEIFFPTLVSPRVSVIIPAHNNALVTFHCLCALLIAANQTSFEVIVVDDGSTDATVDLHTFVKGVTFIRNDVPQRFIRACNGGVQAARGEYIVLLNNDTEPTVGWLDALLKALETLPDAGLVGSKLLYPDGRLQDAGGILWSSGNPWNYGHGDNPWHPKFSYTRACCGHYDSGFP